MIDFFLSLFGRTRKETVFAPQTEKIKGWIAVCPDAHVKSFHTSMFYPSGEYPFASKPKWGWERHGYIWQEVELEVRPWAVERTAEETK